MGRIISSHPTLELDLTSVHLTQKAQIPTETMQELVKSLPERVEAENGGGE